MQCNLDAFQLDIAKPVSGIHPAVLKRCAGKQQPVAPHAQRLLVASRKEAKAPKTEKTKGGQAKGKGKGKNGKGKNGKCESGQGKCPKPKGPKDAKAKGSSSKSDYAVARANFMQQLLLGYCSLLGSK